MGKLREYHGLFKNICSNFCIDPEEFRVIFKLPDSSYFKIWDTSGNGIVDALELFSGLIIYADARAEDKIKCRLRAHILSFV